MDLPGGPDRSFPGPAPSHRSIDLRTAAAVFVVSYLIYFVSLVVGDHLSSEGQVYFDRLASSFLAGRLDIEAPEPPLDLSRHEGKWYLPFPPLPALLLLPGVALLGETEVSAPLASILWAATTVALVYLLLQALADRGLTRLSRAGNLWITAAFGFGSVLWYCALMGVVWYLGQLASLLFVALAALLAARRAPPVLAGLALGVALLGRPNVIFILPFLVGLYDATFVGGWRERWTRVRPVARLLITAMIPFAGLLLLYNWLRFGDALEFGYRAANVAGPLRADLDRFGQFHWHYLGRNFEAMLLLPPRWDAARGVLQPDVRGMSVLLTTPALLWLSRAHSRASGAYGAWIVLPLLLAPLLLYYNTGWTQFGYRFSLDFMIPALVLLAIGAGARPSRWLRAAILFGVAMNAWGAWIWMELFRGQV